MLLEAVHWQPTRLMFALQLAQYDSILFITSSWFILEANPPSFIYDFYATDERYFGVVLLQVLDSFGSFSNFLKIMIETTQI